jgi:hypothetical protein
MARRDEADPAKVIQQAQTLVTPQSEARAQAVLDALVRNRTILERLGCLDKDGMDKLRRGKAPTITKGPYAGELATVDHIIPRSVCPELDTLKQTLGKYLLFSYIDPAVGEGFSSETHTHTPCRRFFVRQGIRWRIYSPHLSEE